MGLTNRPCQEVAVIPSLTIREVQSPLVRWSITCSQDGVPTAPTVSFVRAVLRKFCLNFPFVFS